MAFLYRILESPRAHDLCQRFLAAGRGKAVRLTESFLLDNARGDRILDLGCGTARYAHLFSGGYVGLDINCEYLSGKTAPGKDFVCADSRKMPFRDASFDTIFSVGLFHHVSPGSSGAIFKEMSRVGSADASIMLIDFFYPENRFDLPGWLVSRFDRGSFVRRRNDFIREIEPYFGIVDSRYIEHSYPYNLHAFLLRRRRAL